MSCTTLRRPAVCAAAGRIALSLDGGHTLGRAFFGAVCLVMMGLALTAVDILPPNPVLEWLIAIVEAAFYFYATASLIAEAKPKVVVIDLGGVFDLEYIALKMLIESEKRQREKGVMLWLVGMNPSVLPMVKQSPQGLALGSQLMFFQS